MKVEYIKEDVRTELDRALNIWDILGDEYTKFYGKLVLDLSKTYQSKSENKADTTETNDVDMSGLFSNSIKIIQSSEKIVSLLLGSFKIDGKAIHTLEEYYASFNTSHETLPVIFDLLEQAGVFHFFFISMQQSMKTIKQT